MRYDFIEIGTSDFATEIQKAAGRRGLSVEPMAEYLEALPAPATVQKACCAISDTDGKSDMYYVSTADIATHGLPKWVRGCNKLGAPHPTVARYLAKNGLPASLITKREVPIMTVSSLCAAHSITEIDYLKVDTEGHDIVVLRSLAAAVAAGVLSWPARIKAECNALTDTATKLEMLKLLTTAGYSVERTKDDLNATR